MRTTRREVLATVLDVGRAPAEEIALELFSGRTHCPDCGRETEAWVEHRDEVREHLMELCYDNLVSMDVDSEYRVIERHKETAEKIVDQ